MMQANTRKVLSALEPSNINVRSLGQRAEDYQSADLFMRTREGFLKAVEFRPATQAAVQQSSAAVQRKLYSQALARYIVEQEKQGNKFFIRQPNGVIQHLSVSSNRTD